MRRYLLLAGIALAVACRPAESARASDSAFADVQRRGQSVMGVDQYTSRHVFEDLPDGGRIVLDRDDPSDTAAVRTIRAHMREIQVAFQGGNFAAPGLVHAQDVPGTRVMSEKHGTITYVAADRPKGAEVRIRTSDPDAITAVHEFLAFQRKDHRAAGHDTH